MVDRMTRPPLLVAILYGGVIWLSAFLLFLIQPILAKLILPWFGGSAAVWTTCLVFYQVVLLAGYFYANAMVTRLRPFVQATVHSVLLTAALAFLPVIPGERWKLSAAQHPAANILLLLLCVLGLPYFVLSATSPLLQAWYARRWTDPYRLFALSNAGALMALIAYPILIEPRIATRLQDVLWSAGFVVFAALCAAIAWIGRSPQSTRDVLAKPRGRLTWVALAAAGSMLLLATTSQLTQNVAAVPLLWIVPLAIYLITFILCFESARWYRRGIYLRLLAMALGAVGYAIYDIQLSDTLSISIPIFAGGLFIGCMYCHGELAARTPPEGQLTSFYLMIALGGALGAVLIGLIAPLVFSGVYDLPFAMLVVALLALRLEWSEQWSQRLLWIVAAVAMAVVIGAQVQGYHHNAIVLVRNFYGSLRVVESAGTRTLYHGTIKHGSQFLSESRRTWPTSYYGLPSGIGLALGNCCAREKRVGVIGLGAGTLATYGAPGDEFRFYEINPQVIEIAESQFTFLANSKAKIDIAQGDARLSLEREPPRHFNILVVDAFSGDAIPVHLLTQEAFAVYLRHVEPSGVIAFHVSNQFLDLAPAVRRVAAEYGLEAVEIHSDRDEDRGLSSATWVLVTRNREFLGRSEIARLAVPIAGREIRLWTDDYNNLLQLIR
jgi:hypothetical protein